MIPITVRGEVPVSSGRQTGFRTRTRTLERLQQSEIFGDYQRAFEHTTGLPLELRAAGSMQAPQQGSARANPFCTLMTRGNGTCLACLQLQARLETEASDGATTLECYAGLSESVVPLRVGQEVVGYLQTGQVFLHTPTRPQFKRLGVTLHNTGAPIPDKKMEQKYFRTRVMAGDQYRSMLQLLTIFAEHLSSIGNEMLLREETAEPPMVSKARSFIALHYGEALALADVARAVNTSAFYFCKLFKKSTGLTFLEYLGCARVEEVKRMMRNINTRISEAAFAAGFQSLSQFNRVFNRVAGESPSNFRNRLHGLTAGPRRVTALVKAA